MCHLPRSRLTSTSPVSEQPGLSANHSDQLPGDDVSTRHTVGEGLPPADELSLLMATVRFV